MAYSVNLTVQFQSNYVLHASLGFRITVVASTPSNDLRNLPSNLNYGVNPSTANTKSASAVFRFYQKPTNPDGTIESVFSGVCSWPDYTEFGLAPATDTLPANFRSNTIDLVVESETIAHEVWQLVQEQVTQLMQTIADGQTLTNGATVPCAST